MYRLDVHCARGIFVIRDFKDEKTARKAAEATAKKGFVWVENTLVFAGQILRIDVLQET